MVANMEATLWQFGDASLGSQLGGAKRTSSPAPLSLPPVPPCDLDAEAVIGVPTPDEHTDDDVFFFGRRPLPFGGSPLEAYSRTSGESNHHRQSISDTRVPRYQLSHEDT